MLVSPMDGSHWIQLRALIDELHSKGHNITVLRPEDSWFIKESPLFKTITIKSMSSSEKKLTGFAAKTVDVRVQRSPWEFFTKFFILADYMYKKHKKVVEVVGEMFENKTFMQELREAKYDLMLTDPGQGAGVLLAHRLNLPLVMVARMTVAGQAHSVIAPSPLSYVPVEDLSDKMTFLQRVENMLRYGWITFILKYVMESNYEPFVQHYFGSDVHYTHLLQAADIWLMIADFTFEFPRPTMPNAVYIDGYECKPPKPLPKELEDFVQSSGEHGVIVMSLGTLVAQLPESVVDEFAAAFAKLPQKVIWRLKGRKPHSLGNNTLLLDWLPQSDLLGHKKTKLFVAHGGISGIQEAIYHGVPMVGLPLMFDQPDNFVKMEARGVAKVLDIGTVNKDSFLRALIEVLHDPTYREKMRALSEAHRDTPLKPLDTAVFWVEFVMRHRGAKHLRTESYRLSFIQYHCIDVILFLTAVTLLTVVIIITGLKLLWRTLCYRRKVKKQ